MEKYRFSPESIYPIFRFRRDQWEVFLVHSFETIPLVPHLDHLGCEGCTVDQLTSGFFLEKEKRDIYLDK